MLNQFRLSHIFPLQVFSIIIFLVGLLTTQSCAMANDIVTTSVKLADGIEFITRVKPFNRSEHNTSLCDGKEACIIDGLRAYGATISLPTNEFVSITLKINNHEILLESRGMYNGWSPREDRKIHAWITDLEYRNKIVRAKFSDASATYLVEWEVIDKKSARTLIQCLECMVLSLEDFQAK